jgi:formate dehydrogenase iron-sulfur subunit
MSIPEYTVAAKTVGKGLATMSGTRREFLKIVAAGSATLAAGSVRAGADENHQDIEFGEALSVLVDTVICIGCRKCEWGCSQENKLSDRPQIEYEDKSVFRSHRRPDHSAFTVVNEFSALGKTDRPYTIKVQCMHCNEPACVSACIVGALTKDKRGPVAYDAWKCIGCRYCLVACPFQIPAYEYDNALNPQVKKCTFCFQRVTRDNLPPACVANCPNEALTFGTRQKMLDTAHTRIVSNPGQYHDRVYGEYEAGGTSWLYLAPVDFKYTELPVLSDTPIPQVTETIQHGIFKAFVPPLALYGLLGLVMYSLKDRDQKQDAHDE